MSVEIIPRSVWGARAPKGTAKWSSGQPSGQALHHTAGSFPTTQRQEIAVLREVQRMHMDDRGWNDIAYTRLYAPSGRVYEGRTPNRRPGATRSFNDTHEAECAMGNYHGPHEPTKEMIASLVAVSAEVQPDAETREVLTHKDATRLCRCGATACPGESLYRVADLMEQAVATYRLGDRLLDNASRGPDVDDLVVRLRALYPTFAYGDLGGLIRHHQESTGVTVDGVYGPVSHGKLLQLEAARVSVPDLAEPAAPRVDPGFDARLAALRATPVAEVETLGQVADAVFYTGLQFQRYVTGGEG